MHGGGAAAACFEQPPTGYRPVEVAPRLSIMEMNTEDSLREYLRLFARIPFAGRIGPLARVFDFVAAAAPGVREILAVGKLCYEVRERHYDLVVVDAEASGHVVSQIGAPDAIADLVKVGLIRDQTAWMRRILNDPETTGVVIVTTPEEMPVVETIELAGAIAERTKVALAAVVANRVPPEPFGRSEQQVFDAIDGDPKLRDRITRAAGSAASTVIDAASLAVRLRRHAAEQLTDMRAGIPAEVPVLYVPEMFARSAGRRTVELVATALAEEL